MIVTDTVSEVRSTHRQNPTAQWGFVPTMGYLHEGHLSLVRRAREENDVVAVSIFVNPTQFTPDEDLYTYPRDLDRDIQLLSEHQVDLVFAPEVETIYPVGFQTTVSVELVSKSLEGRARPSHFQGVTTVVTKLFNIVRPAKSYFGQKDAQQCVVLKQMVKDLDFDLEIVVCPIVRESDGLAMSSRNARLSPENRAAAPIIYRSLAETARRFREGERNGDELRQIMHEMLASETRARVDYISLADSTNLEEVSTAKRGTLLSTAVCFGSVRLIDNVRLE